MKVRILIAAVVLGVAALAGAASLMSGSAEKKQSTPAEDCASCASCAK